MGITPGILAIASLATTAVGVGVSAYGAEQQASAQAAAANYNAQEARQNAIVANQNAVRASQSGEAQAAQSEQKTRATVGAIEANQAAGNIDVNSGSAVDVRSSAASLGQLDAITIRSEAAKTAYGFQTQAAGLTDTANLDASQAANDQSAGSLDASSTILGGLGSAGSNFLKFQQAGAFAGGTSTSDSSTPYSTPTPGYS